VRHIEDAIQETAMRYGKGPLALFALLFVAVSLLAACAGGEKAPATDSSAAAAAAAPPPAPDMFTVMAKDGSWSVDMNSSNIIWRRTKGKKDSLVFDFKAPSVDGAMWNYESIRTAPDTHTFAARLVASACSDNAKKDYTHMAQIWVDQVAYSGCAVKK
jgi:uncharacterized membrane protein